MQAKGQRGPIPGTRTQTYAYPYSPRATDGEERILTLICSRRAVDQIENLKRDIHPAITIAAMSNPRREQVDPLLPVGASTFLHVWWSMAYDAPCGGSGRYARPA
eukprot:4712793-Prymnesium_polylepis.1